MLEVYAPEYLSYALTIGLGGKKEGRAEDDISYGIGETAEIGFIGDKKNGKNKRLKEEFVKQHQDGQPPLPSWSRIKKKKSGPEKGKPDFHPDKDTLNALLPNIFLRYIKIITNAYC